MSIVRSHKKRNPYVQVDKTAFLDKRLTWQAKGMLIYILSKPDDWSIRITDLVNQTPKIRGQGKEAVQSIIKELEQHGYVARKRIRNEKNQFSGWETIVFETPEDREEWGKSDDPDDGFTRLSGEPETGQPKIGSPGHLTNKEDLLNKDLTNNPPNPPKGECDRSSKNQEIGNQQKPLSDQQAKQSGKKRKRKRSAASQQTSEQILAELPEAMRDRFDKFWRGYSAFCNQRQAKVGAKKQAVIAWKFLVESDFCGRGLEAFNKGVSLFVKQQGNHTSGIPHAVRFLYSTKNGSGAWEDAIDQATSGGSVSDLSPEANRPLYPVYEAPKEEPDVYTPPPPGWSEQFRREVAS